MIVVLDDSEWLEVPDPEYEAAEAEYGGGNGIDSIPKGGEILVVSDSEGNEDQVKSQSRSQATR